jgi:hypothetical protein
VLEIVNFMMVVLIADLRKSRDGKNQDALASSPSLQILEKRHFDIATAKVTFKDQRSHRLCTK